MIARNLKASGTSSEQAEPFLPLLRSYHFRSVKDISENDVRRYHLYVQCKNDPDWFVNTATTDDINLFAIYCKAQSNFFHSTANRLELKSYS